MPICVTVQSISYCRPLEDSRPSHCSALLCSALLCFPRLCFPLLRSPSLSFALLRSPSLPFALLCVFCDICGLICFASLPFAPFRSLSLPFAPFRSSSLFFASFATFADCFRLSGRTRKLKPPPAPGSPDAARSLRSRCLRSGTRRCRARWGSGAASAVGAGHGRVVRALTPGGCCKDARRPGCARNRPLPDRTPAPPVASAVRSWRC